VCPCYPGATWDCCNLRVRVGFQRLPKPDTAFVLSPAHLRPVMRWDWILATPLSLFQNPLHVVGCASGIFHPMKGLLLCPLSRSTYDIRVTHFEASSSMPVSSFHHIHQLNPALHRVLFPIFLFPSLSRFIVTFFIDCRPDHLPHHSSPGLYQKSRHMPRPSSLGRTSSPSNNNTTPASNSTPSAPPPTPSAPSGPHPSPRAP
jgi:hypothetical protein